MSFPPRPPMGLPVPVPGRIIPPAFGYPMGLYYFPA